MKNKLTNVITTLHKKYLKSLERRLERKAKILDMKSKIQKNSHSLFWVWEFSKKAVLICFAFYIIVQLYSMTVMVVYQDFTYLGDLITQAGEIVKDAIFAYLIKSGVENIFKKYSNNSHADEDDAVG